MFLGKLWWLHVGFMWKYWGLWPLEHFCAFYRNFIFYGFFGGFNKPQKSNFSKFYHQKVNFSKSFFHHILWIFWGSKILKNSQTSKILELLPQKLNFSNFYIKRWNFLYFSEFFCQNLQYSNHSQAQSIKNSKNQHSSIPNPALRSEPLSTLNHPCQKCHIFLRWVSNDESLTFSSERICSGITVKFSIPAPKGLLASLHQHEVHDMFRWLKKLFIKKYCLKN